MSETKQPAKKTKTTFSEVGNCLFVLAFFLVVVGIIALLIYSFFHYDYSYYDKGWWNIVSSFLKQLGLMIAFSCGIVLLVGIALMVQTVAGRWRKIRIFLSYQHEHLALVKSLHGSLQNRWITPNFIPFEPAEHDTIIQKVQRYIKQADLILIAPGSYRSFVDAEIMGASIISKPIVFLKVIDNQTTPDTSFKGYPVFNLQKLESYKFEPLQRFVLYVCNSSKDVTRNFARTLEAFKKEAGNIFMVFFVLSTIGRFAGPLINVFVSAEWEQRTYIYIYWGVTIIATIFFSISYIQVVFDRVTAIKVTRQKILTQDCTAEILARTLSELEGDRQIVDCILFQPLPTRH